MSVSSTRSQPLSYTSSSYAPSTVSRRSSYVPTLSLSLPSLPRSLTSRFLQLMDSIYAILAGLSLRLLLSNLSYSNFKVTGTLVGLWEGVITLHFIKKWPKSSDPYLAYFVRLGIDFMFSESSDSVERMVLVIIWTGLGMVLADIAPSIWRDVGLKRVWRRFRRDLYHLTTMVPTVAFFPPTRTVRFSPSRVPSVIEEEDEDDSKSQISQTSPSVIATTELATTTAITPSQISTSVPLVDVIAEPPQRVRRRVPGYFPDDITETESTISSPPPRVSRRISSNGRTSRRLSVFPTDAPFTDEEEEEHDDLDDANISSSTTGSNMTERGAQTDDIDMTRITVDDIPEIQDETTPVDVEPSISEGSFIAVPGIAPGAITIDTGVGMAATTKDGETTPRGHPHNFLPPTPSDSAARWTRRYEKRASGSGAGAGNPPPLPLGLGLGAGNPNNGNTNPDSNDADAQSHHTRPISAFLPQIPDLETGSLTDNDWHKIQKADLESSNGRAPTPPPKDAEEAAQHNPNVFADNNNANAHVNPANDAQLAALDAALNFVSQPTENQAAPPAYQEPNYMDDDDMYVDDPLLHQPTVRRFDPYSAGNEAEAWGLGQGFGSGVPPATTGSTFNFGGAGAGAGAPAPSFGSNNPFSFGHTSSSFTNPSQPTFAEIQARMAAQEAENARLDEKLRAEQERKEQVERDAEEARRLRAEKEEEDRRRQEAEEEERKRIEEEMQRAEEEEKEAEKKRQEKEERRLKEEADELVRQARIAELQKKEEEERLAREKAEEEARIEEERVRLEKEAKKEEKKRIKKEEKRKEKEEKEEAARLKKEEEERLKQEEEEKKERQRLSQEAAERRAEEAKRKAEEQEAKKAEEAEAERKEQEEQAAAEAEAVRKAAEEEEEKKRLDAEEAAEVEAAKRMAEEEAAHIASIGDAQRAAEEDERQRGEAEAKAAAARGAREKEEEDARLTAESQDLDRQIQAFVAEEEDANKTQQQAQQQDLFPQDEAQVSTPRVTPQQQLHELQHPEGDLLGLDSPVEGGGEGGGEGEGAEREGAGGPKGEGAEGGEDGDDNLDDIASVTSDMSVVPSANVGPRLERLIVLRAQKYQLEQQIEALKAKGVGSDNPRMEKLVRVVDKYGKKLMKMWEKGVDMATYNEETDMITLDSLNEIKSGQKIEERLERLLYPGAKSLSFSIQVGTKKATQGKQKMVVAEIREYYGFLPYTIEDQHNRKLSTTDIPEEKFGEWLAEFRRLAGKGEQDEPVPTYDDPWAS